jgi:hypothetical protein
MKTSQKMDFKNYLRLTIVAVLSFGALNALAQKKVQSAAPKVDMGRLVFHSCKNECSAKKAVKELTTFSMPTSKDGMKNPLGVNVCQEQLKGQLAFIKLKAKERGVCQFADGSSVELAGLHSESEKFIKP